jgi:hypothetical protein
LSRQQKSALLTHLLDAAVIFDELILY